VGLGFELKVLHHHTQTWVKVGFSIIFCLGAGLEL
jgi:hypothetical protein